MSVYALLLVVCVFIIEVEGRPSWADPDRFFDRSFQESKTQCAYDVDILELCQRCAKATKSDYAYPMCCTNEDNAVQWCRDYVYFGIQ